MTRLTLEKALLIAEREEMEPQLDSRRISPEGRVETFILAARVGPEDGQFACGHLRAGVVIFRMVCRDPLRSSHLVELLGAVCLAHPARPDRGNDLVGA